MILGTLKTCHRADAPLICKTQISGLDGAIRENRQGKVRVAEEAIPEPELDLLRSRMVVLDRANDPVSRYQIWQGYSPDFEPLELGATAPLYDAIIHRSGDGTCTIEFFRR